MDCKKYISELKKTMPERSIESAKIIAKEILKKLNINKYPVPIVKILRDLGFSIYTDDLSQRNISGYIMVYPDLVNKFKTDRIVVIDKNDTYGRQRFTLAHEFAHYLFDFNEDSDTCFVSTYDLNNSDDKQEMIPSRFAAELLMPEDLFIERYKELSNLTNYKKTQKLLSDFEVSAKSVNKRIQELGLKNLNI